jgi:hypothetical protein
MRARFIELEKNTYEKELLSRYYFLAESKIENRKISDIIKEKTKLSNR